MCGVFGVVSAGPLPEAPELLEELTDLLAHRGPDDRGSYREPTIFLGHRRLSIIDRAGGHQPMSTPDGRYVVVYNGEIYNFKEIRHELRQRGYEFLTETDTDVLLGAYREWGEECVQRLRGMFAFAIWDATRRVLFLVRDRLGIKPLYYAFINGRLVFASEMKAISRHPEFRREADLGALSSYLSFRTSIGPSTVFKRLFSLPPGHYLRYVAGQASLHLYWDVPSAAAKGDRGETFYRERLRDMLPQIVRSHMVGDVPLGAYLSGGVDSSLLVSMMADLQAGPVKTYSVGFDVPGYDEGEEAELVSRHLGTRHERLLIGPETFLDSLEPMIRHRDQPLSIPHEPALLALSHHLRKDVTVCLSGEGADELFGGYGRVQRSPMDYRKLHALRRLPEPIQAAIRARIGDPDLRARLASGDDVDHFLSVYHWWPLAEKAGILNPDVWAEAAGKDAMYQRCHQVFETCRSNDPYDRVFYFFEKVHLVNLLERLDMQSMAASVEARVPFVDHELVEFVSAVPLRHKMRWKSLAHMLRALFMTSDAASETMDTSKYLLRRLADERLPKRISRRRKLGFPAPLDAWLNGPLRQRAREILLDPVTRRRGLFNMAAVEHLLLGDPGLKYDFFGKRIWMLMNVEIWFRLHIDPA